MSLSKSTFNSDWTDKNIYPDLAVWVKSLPNDPFSAYCSFCKKKISLSNMGKQALTSHVKNNKKHKTLIDNFIKSKLDDFVGNAESSKTQTEESGKTNFAPAASTSGQSLSDFLLKQNALKAEIIWALKLVESHSSFNAFDNIAEIFSQMFSDSSIASKCTLGRSKMAYLICYGLAPYFQEALLKSLKNQKYVVCFDEALNRIAQKCQMDLIVRYWCDSSNRVSSRYLNSVFLRRTTAVELFENFKKAISGLDVKFLLQISMDGPNVNLKFLRHVKSELLAEQNCQILDLGTCGLHIIHGAFQFGHKSTGWKLDAVLRGMYSLFKDSPARRANFMEIAETSEFPLKFCSVRWVENVNVCERAIQVFPYIKKFVESAENSLPSSATCETVVKACNDKLVIAKISFFSYIANILQPFLKKFQSPKPMVPFLYDNLFILLKQLMQNVVKDSKITEAKTLEELFEIDLEDPNNLKLRKNTTIGIVTANYLNLSKVSESEKRNFLTDCFTFVKSSVKKIFERMSKSFAIMKAASSLNPNLIKNNPVLSQKRMSDLLQLLYSSDKISPACAERANIQFGIFLEKLKNEFVDQLNSFNEDVRLDDFYYNMLNFEEYSDLWQITKIVLILSHGNAAVESGFSVNKDMIVENLKEDSLIGLRTVYDAIHSYGSVLSVPITKGLMQYAKLSRMRYHDALKKQKAEEEMEREAEINKRKASDQIKLLQKKKMKLLNEKSAEIAQIDAEISELAKTKNS